MPCLVATKDVKRVIQRSRASPGGWVVRSSPAASAAASISEVKTAAVERAHADPGLRRDLARRRVDARALEDATRGDHERGEVLLRVGADPARCSG
jgi:hypothetical protein